jgi:ubiquinone/menaquinone biosynthesis C-methylase UbiE
MDSHGHRFDPRRKAYLISPEREARWQPVWFVQHLKIDAGQRVLDLGCGPGFWTLPLAERVGQTGTVWALDVSQELLDMLAGRRPPAQVHLLQSELPEIKLPADSVDLSWAAFVMHEVTPLDRMAHELRRVGPRAAILDWRPDATGESGPPSAHRLWPSQICDALLAAGFEAAQQTWQDADAYLVEAGPRENTSI